MDTNEHECSARETRQRREKEKSRTEFNLDEMLFISRVGRVSRAELFPFAGFVFVRVHSWLLLFLIHPYFTYPIGRRRILPVTVDQPQVEGRWAIAAVGRSGCFPILTCGSTQLDCPLETRLRRREVSLSKTIQSNIKSL